MALHMLTGTPSFTVTLRGYDKEEVDEYIESLSHTRGDDVEALEQAEATIRSLESEIRRHAERVTKLESCIRDETPRSISALGERLTLILEQAEATANETVAQARQEADSAREEASQAAERITRYATYQASEAETRAVTVTRNAEERARQLEEEATNRAAVILDDAEAQAEARIAEINEWVGRVRAQIISEQQQAAETFAITRARREAELHEIVLRRDALLTSLTAVCESVRGTVDAARLATNTHGGDGHVGEVSYAVVSAPSPDTEDSSTSEDRTNDAEREEAKLFDGEQ